MGKTFLFYIDHIILVKKKKYLLYKGKVHDCLGILFKHDREMNVLFTHMYIGINH